jgi:hypothetical protein
MEMDDSVNVKYAKKSSNDGGVGSSGGGIKNFFKNDIPKLFKNI